MTRLKTAALALAAAFACAAPAAAADFQAIRREIAVARSADAVWAAVGDYCVIKTWFKLDSCVYSAGTGGVGTTRKLNGMVEEVMVASTAHSYAYYQTVGNMAANAYHGAVEVEATGPRSSKIVYTLVYDQQPLADDAARTATRARLETRFQGAVEAMKAVAEARP
jgi:hypothetical protein